MSLRETVNAFGHDVSAHFRRDGYCAFAAAEETEGFLDTSAELDGSRGIAFLCDRIRVDLDGVIRQMNYGDIAETEIVESFESDFADELLIKGKTVVRVSDFSINKRFLKLLVDTLCLRYGQFSAEEKERFRRECRARSSARYAEMDEAAAAAARHMAERGERSGRSERGERSAKGHKRPVSPAVHASAVNPAPQPRAVRAVPEERREERERSGVNAAAKAPAPPAAPPAEPSPKTERVSAPTAAPALDIEEPRFSVPEDHVPLEITEEKIEWLSGPKERDNAGKPDDTGAAVDIDITEDTDEIGASELEGMSREETMSYLLSSINEINAPAEPENVTVPAGDNRAVEDWDIPDEPQSEYTPPVIAELAAPENEASSKDKASPKNETPPKDGASKADADESEPTAESSLTPEPNSDDIYIKASRKIREICESGRLTREEIQTALKNDLVSAAARFAEIAGEGADIPRLIAPKIEELRAASENLPRYFALGEDIAERVMFFMMYQMLSYSDRIVEAPETKERLNYFFKRYGPSGIMLSMLDMRVQ